MSAERQDLAFHGIRPFNLKNPLLSFTPHLNKETLYLSEKRRVIKLEHRWLCWEESQVDMRGRKALWGQLIGLGWQRRKSNLEKQNCLIQDISECMCVLLEREIINALFTLTSAESLGSPSCSEFDQLERGNLNSSLGVPPQSLFL